MSIPAHREAVAAFGDLSSVAIPMFGGVDPGEIDDPDAVRAVATRRLAGMGVDTDGRRRRGWPATARSGCSPPTPTAGASPTSRTRASTPRWCSPARCWPAGCPRPCTWAATPTKNLEPVWPALWAYYRWLAEFVAAAPGRRTGCIPIDLHDMDQAVEAIAWARDHGIHGGVMLPAMSLRTGLPGYADEYYEPLWSACEEHGIVVNLHTGASGSATDAKQLYDDRHGGFLGLYEVVRVHPSPPVVHDLRRRLRPAPRPTGGGHRERGAVAALAGAGHGGLLRHPRRGPGALLPVDAARRSTWTATCTWAGRSCSAPRPRCARRSASTGSCGAPTTPTSKGPHRSTAWSCARCSGGCPSLTSAGSSGATPAGCSASTGPSSRRWPTGSVPRWPTCPDPSTGTTSPRPSAGAWPVPCPWPRPPAPAS